jgi:hypothetical protein
LIEKSASSGLETMWESSSRMTIGFATEPSISSLTRADGKGSLTFRQVAFRARQARSGASDETDEAVEMEEMEEARDERERSDIMDSGLEPDDEILMTDGRRERG